MFEADLELEKMRQDILGDRNRGISLSAKVCPTRALVLNRVCPTRSLVPHLELLVQIRYKSGSNKRLVLFEAEMELEKMRRDILSDRNRGFSFNSSR